MATISEWFWMFVMIAIIFGAWQGVTFVVGSLIEWLGDWFK